LLDSRQLVIGAAFGSGAAGLLPAGAGGQRARAWHGAFGQGGGVFGLAAEQPLFQGTNLGLERVDVLAELLFALHGAVMHGLPVGRLAPGFKLGGQARADRARQRGQWGSAAGSGGIREERERSIQREA